MKTYGLKGLSKTLSLIIVGLLIGIPTGTGLATFIFAEGHSYLSKDPVACTNCHVMKGQFDSWQASSHHPHASCNDCHSHGSLPEKYLQKGINGFLHSYAFTTGKFKEPLQIKEFNRKIALRSCRDCHSQLIESSQGGHSSFGSKNCLNCHKDVGHRR